MAAAGCWDGGRCTADGRSREGGCGEWWLYWWLHWRRSRVSRTWRIAPQGVTPHSPSSHILGSNPADVTDWGVEPVQPPAQLPHCCVPHPHTTHTTPQHITPPSTQHAHDSNKQLLLLLFLRALAAVNVRREQRAPSTQVDGKHGGRKVRHHACHVSQGQV